MYFAVKKCFFFTDHGPCGRQCPSPIIYLQRTQTRIVSRCLRSQRTGQVRPQGMMGVTASAKCPKDLQTKSWGGGEDKTDQISRVYKDLSRDGLAPGDWQAPMARAVCLYEGDSGLRKGRQCPPLGPDFPTSTDKTLPDPRYPTTLRSNFPFQPHWYPQR